jgi:hypothetical protein
MPVPVMDVREMRMPMNDRGVPVGMRVRLGAVPREPMHMLVMLVMHVRVAVLDLFVLVLVLVLLGQV